MKKILLLLFASLAFARADAATINISGSLTGTNNWFSTNTYLLNGPVYVVSNGVLNIEAGTVIKGQTNSTAATIAALYVTRGAKIFANGTANSPIIFTSVLDDVTDPFDLPLYQRGLWGGVVLFGKAKINTASDAAGNAATPKYEVYEGLSDTQISGEFVHRFGGSDDEDSSGVFRYVSIRHGGKVLESNKEINGLSLGAVGRGTTLEYVECYAIADDGFEFFGGTVNAKHLVSAFNDDDTFDADEGYSGKLQFLFSIQESGARDKGWELNGEPSGIAVGAAPTMRMEVYNATTIGAGTNGGGSANNVFTIRDYASPSFYNCIFTDYSQRGLSISANSTNFLNTGSLDMRNNIWWGFGTGANANTITNIVIDNGAVLFTDSTRSNSIVNPQLRGIGRNDMGGLDPRPQSGSPALSGGRTPPNDGFYTATAYKGAFDANDLWISGWTALSQYEIIKPRGGLTNLVSGSLTGTNNWTRDTTYLLNGPVHVVSNGVLNIEAGTVIKGQTNSTAATIAALYVTRGAKIFANGTANSPIIFTSVLDDVTDPFDLPLYQRGLWGGVVLFGKAKINTASDAAGNAATPKYEVYEGLSDTQISGEFVHRFGGSDDEDSSGVFRYVSIRHGGKVLESNKEINGLSLGAVGRGTTLEYVECYAIADDGFEFFGGTVNAKHLVSAFNDDDTFDADEGYSGKLQFLFSIQESGARDKGWELNGEPSGIAVGAAPTMRMEVYNATTIGAGTNGGGSANNVFTIRDYASPSFYNCIFTDYSQRGLSISANSTNFLNTGSLDMRNNIWWGFGTGANANTITNIVIDNGAVLFTDSTRSNSIVNPQLRGIGRNDMGGLDPRPQSGSPALSGGRTPPNDGFYTATAYKGAFKTVNWAADWTALSEYHILNGAGGGVPASDVPTPVISAPVITYSLGGGNITLTITSESGRTYQLQSVAALGASPAWANAGAAVPGTGSNLQFVQPITTGSNFYRIAVQ